MNEPPILTALQKFKLKYAWDKCLFSDTQIQTRIQAAPKVEPDFSLYEFLESQQAMAQEDQDQGVLNFNSDFIEKL